MRLYFKVNNPAEEHAIVGRFLCSACKKELDLERQELLSEERRLFAGDLVVCRCTQCQKRYRFIFYLPPDYDPLKFARNLLGKKLELN